MKSNIIILSSLLILFSACVKDPKIEKVGSVTCEKNGIAAEMLFNGIFNRSDSTFSFHFLILTTDKQQPFNFYVLKQKGRQYILSDSRINAPMFITSAHTGIFEYDIPVAEYSLDVSDTANNFFDITYEQDHFTRDLKAEFSATFYKEYGPDVYPDTVRLRNGRLDLTGVTVPKWE